MPSFEVLSGGVLVGHFEMEHGDPPMGVASGKFFPLPAYDSIPTFTVRDIAEVEVASQSHPSLIVRDVDGRELVPSGGVQISDYSAELGPDGLTVEIVGIGYPMYAELFPEHVVLYRNHWAKKIKASGDRQGTG
ncbi:MAG: hypothetical protein ABSC48_08595 [Terracidiphilus sp.]